MSHSGGVLLVGINLQFGSGELFHAPQGAFPLELAVDTSQMNKEKQTD